MDFIDTTLAANSSCGGINMTVTQSCNDTMASGPVPQKLMEGPNMPLFRFICEVGISFPIAVFGICGNILAFVVLCRQKQRLTTSVLLQALAVADTLVLISAILLRSMRYVGWDAFDNVYDYIFVILYPCVYFFRLADTWLIVILTIDRYIAVCHPLQAQHVCTLRRTYFNICVITLVTLVFSLPRFFEYRMTDREVSAAGFVSMDLTRSMTYTLLYRISLFFLAMYLVPMMLLIVLNIRLLCTLRRAYRHRHAMICSGGIHSGKHGNPTTDGTSRGVTIIVVTVVLLCVSCNVVAMTAHVLWALGECLEHLRKYLEIYRRFIANISNVLVTINCAINFIIYCMFSRKFRDGFQQTCQCHILRHMASGCRSDHHGNSSGAANTSYTSLGRMPNRMSAKINIKDMMQQVNTKL